MDKVIHSEMAPTKEEMEESKHFLRVVQAYRNYSRDSKERLYRTWEFFQRVPTKHQKMLSKEGFETNLKNVENCIEINAKVIGEFVGENFFFCPFPKKLHIKI